MVEQYKKEVTISNKKFEFFFYISNGQVILPFYLGDGSIYQKPVILDFLLEDMEVILPKTLSEEYCDIMYDNFWLLLRKHYYKYSRILSSDLEYYVALLNYLSVQMIFITHHVNITLENQILVCRDYLIKASKEFNVPIDIDLKKEPTINIEKLFSVFPRLNTERLLLRPLSIIDISQLNLLYNDKDFQSEFLPEPMIVNNDNIKYIINESLNNFYTRKAITWGIELKSTNTIIGFCDLFVDSSSKPPILQTAILKDFRNNGYSQERLVEIIDFLKESDISSLIFNCSENNEAVIHIANKFKSTIIYKGEGRLKYLLELN